MDKINYIENLRYEIPFDNVTHAFLYFLSRQDGTS